MDEVLESSSMIAGIDSAIAVSGSQVCVGLDPDPAKMPIDDIYDFNRTIIDATRDIAAAYKPQLAFYEAIGIPGLQALENTVRYIRDAAPHAFIIGDGKRGDMGNTAQAYAKAMFNVWNFDACTIYPYQGSDSILPFLEYTDKGVFVVCRTSNPSSVEIQDILSIETGEMVYETVARESIALGDGTNVGLVIGATFPDELRILRQTFPDTPFLVPGVGAQGGDAATTARVGGHRMLINSSRGVIYASNDPDTFGQAARQAVLQLRDQIQIGRTA